MKIYCYHSLNHNIVYFIIVVINILSFQQLCLDIYLVRESGELDLEEDLFAKLVFLYRSPETLIKWTRPPEEVPPEEAEDMPQLAA